MARKFNEVNPTTFAINSKKNSLQLIVGDEKQKDFFPRVKLKKWSNEANFSIGIAHTKPKSALVKSTSQQISWMHGDIEARFYERSRKHNKSPTQIRYIKNYAVSPEEAAAMFELDHHNGLPNPLIVTGSVNKETILYHGLRSSKWDGVAVNADIQQVRVAAATYANPPIFLDQSVIVTTIHYRSAWGDDPIAIRKVSFEIIKKIFKKYKILIYEQASQPQNLYFKHRDKLILFVSSIMLDGKFTFYINLGCDQSKIFNFLTQKSTGQLDSLLAYGIRAINPNIQEDLIDDFVKLYAEKSSLPVEESVLTEQERTIIRRLAKIHTNENWISNATRKDVYAFDRDEGTKDEFEFDVVLSKKPESNKLLFSIETKNLHFFKQNELTEQEKLEGCIRPPRVIGSYAVYHAQPDSTLHKTGKAFHLFRPIIEDSDGNRVWGNLKIDNDKKLLTITIPQKFLNSATYPIIVDPNFGYTSVGLSFMAFDGLVVGNYYTLPAGMNIRSMSAYLSGAAPGGNYQYAGAIYQYSTGNRKALTANSASITAAITAGWYNLTLSSPSTEVLIDSADDHVVVFGGGDSGAVTVNPCCFIFLEASFQNGVLPAVVRRARDEHMTPKNKRGYYRLATVLVPLMRKSKCIKFLVKYTMVKPLIIAGNRYYGKNRIGIIFYPVAKFWAKIFDYLGDDHEFIRENGEVV